MSLFCNARWVIMDVTSKSGPGIGMLYINACAPTQLKLATVSTQNFADIGITLKWPKSISPFRPAGGRRFAGGRTPNSRPLQHHPRPQLRVGRQFPLVPDQM